MKLLVLIAAILLSGLLYLLFFSGGSEEGTLFKGDRLTLKNTEYAHLTIQTGEGDIIHSDLKDKSGKIRFFSVGEGDDSFEFSEEWKDIFGTITVPDNILIVIDNQKSVPFFITHRGGSSSGSSSSPIQIETSLINKINLNGEELAIEGNTPITITPNEEGGSTTTPTSNTSNSDEENDDSEEGDEEECRDDSCCSLTNQNTPTPVCLGSWRYNVSLGECEYHCPTEERKYRT